MVKTITEPSEEIFTLKEAKAWLRVTDTDEDELIFTLIKGVRQSVERYLNRRLIDTVCEQYFDDFPRTDIIELGIGGVSAIDSIKYYVDGVLTTYASANYTLDDTSLFPRIGLLPDKNWPTPDQRVNAVVVKFTSGYGTTRFDVPEAIIKCAKMMLADAYDYREDMVKELNQSGKVISIKARYYLKDYRVWRM